MVQVENYLYATSQEAQTTLRSILGQAHLDELLSERERLGQMLQEVIDEHTDPWGVKVTQVAVKAVDLPHEMQRAMASRPSRSARSGPRSSTPRASWRRREQLTEAAQALHAEPIALHLRYLQTLTEIAAEKNSTIIFPVPIDLMKAFMRRRDRDERSRSRAPAGRRRAHHTRGHRDLERPRAAALAAEQRRDGRPHRPQRRRHQEHLHPTAGAIVYAASNNVDERLGENLLVRGQASPSASTWRRAS